MVLFLHFTTFSAFALEDALVLKGGFNVVRSKVEALSGTKDSFGGVGFNTHFGYKWTKWEGTLSSYVFWGKIESELQFDTNNRNISGFGTYQNVSFGPIIKRHSRILSPADTWTLYYGAGPQWSLKTIKISRFTNDDGGLGQNRKMTYQSFGGIAVIGIEEDLADAKLHPMYVELGYGYAKSNELSIVDISKVEETNILSKEDQKPDVTTHFFILSFGMSIF